MFNDKSSNASLVGKFFLICFGLALIGVAGYFVIGHFSKNSSTANKAKSVPLVITRTNSVSTDDPANFTSKVTNATTAKNLLAQVRKLQQMPSGITKCPSGNGVVYQLQFSNPSVTVQVETTGCQKVTFSDTDTVYTANTTDGTGLIFFADLSKATGKAI